MSVDCFDMRALKVVRRELADRGYVSIDRKFDLAKASGLPVVDIEAALEYLAAQARQCHHPRRHFVPEGQYWVCEDCRRQCKILSSAVWVRSANP